MKIPCNPFFAVISLSMALPACLLFYVTYEDWQDVKRIEHEQWEQVTLQQFADGIAKTASCLR